MVTDKQKNPGDLEHDVLTRSIGYNVGGEKLREAELPQNCVFILNAGHETATKLIGKILVALIKHPQNRAKLLLKQELFTRYLFV